MQIAISSMFVGDVPIETMLGFSTSINHVTAIDVWYDTPSYLMAPEIHRSNIKSVIREFSLTHGLKLVSHVASVDVNPIAYNPEIRAAAVAELERSVAFAGEIGSKALTFHGGENSFSGEPTSIDLDLLDDSIDHLLSLSSARDVLLTVENATATGPGFRSFETLQGIERVLEAFPRVGVTLDLAHVAKSSVIPRKDTSLARLDGSTIVSFLDTWGDRVAIVHVSTPSRAQTHGNIDLSPGSASRELFEITVDRVPLKDLVVVLECGIDTLGGKSLAQTILEEAARVLLGLAGD